MHGKAEDFGRLQPGIGHIVAVTDPGNDATFQAIGIDDAALVHAAGFDESKQVGEDLAGVEFVGQTVDDRHP